MMKKAASDGTLETADSGTLIETRRKRAASPEKGHYLRAAVTRVTVGDRPRVKRCDIQDMTRPLKKWLVCHRKNPYPDRKEKEQLAELSHMNNTQVSNWFTNARRRLRNTVPMSVAEFTWEKCIRLYNQYADSKCEPLICSDDEGNFGDSEGEEDAGVASVSARSSALSVAAVGASDNVVIPGMTSKAVNDNDGVLLPTQRNTVDSLDRVMTRQQVQNQNNVQFGDDEMQEGSAFRPPQFKKAMMQRFLDCCNGTAATTSSPMLLWAPQTLASNFAFEGRYRHASGSTDCDDRSSSYLSSCRPSPTAELLFSDEGVDGDFSRFWPSGGVQCPTVAVRKKPDDDLDTLELSAALGIATMIKNKGEKGRAATTARK